MNESMISGPVKLAVFTSPLSHHFQFGSSGAKKSTEMNPTQTTEIQPIGRL